MLGLLGAAAIVFSAVAYSLGSVVARPLTKTTNATFLSGLTMLLGGLIDNWCLGIQTRRESSSVV